MKSQASLTTLPSELFRQILDPIFDPVWWGPANSTRDKEARATSIKLRLVCKRFDGYVLEAAHRHADVIRALPRFRRNKAILTRLMVENVRRAWEGRPPVRGWFLTRVICASCEAVEGLGDAEEVGERREKLWYGLARAALSCLGPGRFVEYLLSGDEIGPMRKEEKKREMEEMEDSDYYTESDSDISILSDGGYYTFSRMAREEKERERESRYREDQADLSVYENEYVLIAAAAAGDVSLCRRVLGDGVNVNFSSCFFGHAIHAAVLWGQEDTIQMLLEQEDLDVNVVDTQKMQTPLVLAAMRGDEAAVKLLLSIRQDIQPNTEDCYSFTALRWACRRGNEGVVSLLLKYPGTDINYGGSWRPVRPLVEAVRGKHESIVRLLLEQPDIDLEAGDPHGRYCLLDRVLSAFRDEGADTTILQLLVDKDARLLNGTSPKATPPLWVAALELQSVPLVRFFMSQDGIALNPRNDKATLLHEAVARGDANIVRELLRWEKLDPNIKDGTEDQDTALHTAFQRGRHEVIEALLECSRVDVNAMNASGTTPLILVSSTQRDELEPMVKLLLDREDIKPDLPANDSITALHWAVMFGWVGLVKLLLARNDVNPDRLTEGGWTPLLRIAYNNGPNSLEIARLLLARKGVNATYRNEKGHDAFFVAARSGNPATVKMLLEEYQLFDLNLRDCNGQTVLHHIALMETPSIGDPLRLEKELVPVVEYLIERGDVDINTEDNFGRTPLSYAIEENNESLAQLLSSNLNIEE